MAVTTKQKNAIITGDEIAFHDSQQILVPNGMTYSRLLAVITRMVEDQETPTEWNRTYLYRIDDGAYAISQVMKKTFGVTLGHAQETMFGVMPAETRTITIGVNSTMQVPWGQQEIPSLPGLRLLITGTRHREYGTVFYLAAMGPKKYKPEVEKLFDDTQTFLEQHSIYRGQAIIGAEDPEFLDLSKFDRDKVVFSTDVEAVLDGSLFAPIRYADAMRAEGVPLKRSILLHGPYGTGKTSTGQITAQLANANGWTFLSARPGRDDVADVLRTAKLYQPAVVFVEDVDGAASVGEDDQVAKLLDAFDGITAKGGEIVVVMTTNHIEKIHKGMLRPGRLDAVLEISTLDRPAVERLIKAVVLPGKLAPTVDFDEVFKIMHDFLPAFIREAVTRAVQFAIGRNHGSRDYLIDTADLVGAAHSLKPQLDALNNASEGTRKPVLETALAGVISGAMTNLAVDAGGHGEWSIIEQSDDE